MAVQRKLLHQAAVTHKPYAGKHQFIRTCAPQCACDGQSPSSLTTLPPNQGALEVVSPPPLFTANRERVGLTSPWLREGTAVPEMSSFSAGGCRWAPRGGLSW